MIGVLIPSYRSAGTLPALLDEVLCHVDPEQVLVIDDGSADGSELHCRERGVDCFSHSVNQGKGAALRRGYGIWQRRGAEAVITLDADAQHDPASIPDFLHVYRELAPDLVIGDRGIDHTPMDWDRRFSNRTSTWLLNRRTGFRLRDSQCGYRLLSMELWGRMRPAGDHFELESAILLEAARLGATIEQVPVTQRVAREPSRISRAKDIWRFVCCLRKGDDGSL